MSLSVASSPARFSGSPLLPGALPGWFGKLPGMGDFAHRRLPPEFRAAWDAWLAGGLSLLRQRHADWAAHYLAAPVWCFALGSGVAGGSAWIGVLMPSVDGVGRYFPMTLAVEVVAVDSLAGDALQGALRWWGCAARAALDGLEGDLDAERFDALLGGVFGGDVSVPGDVAAASDVTVVADATVVVDVADGVGMLAMPAAGASLWLGDPFAVDGVQMGCAGLPVDGQFEGLFLGFAEEV